MSGNKAPGGEGGEHGVDAFHRIVQNNLFIAGVGCGMLLSSFTLRNAAGAVGGVVAGLWYQQEVGAPDVARYFAKAEDMVRDLVDQSGKSS